MTRCSATSARTGSPRSWAPASWRTPGRPCLFGACVTGTVGLDTRSNAEALRWASIVLHLLLAAWLTVAVRLPIVSE